jgi:hypothetical protein
MSHASDVATWIRETEKLRVVSWTPSLEAERLIGIYEVAKRRILAGRFNGGNLSTDQQTGSLLVIYGPNALAALDLQPESLRKTGERQWPGLRERIVKALKET